MKLLSRFIFSASFGCLALIGFKATAAAACLPAPAGLVEPGVLTVGVSLTQPPMGFVKDGQPAGFDTDLATALAEKMCLKSKFVDLTFQGLFPALIAKKFDIVSARVGITDARKKTFDFVPVFKGGLKLVVRKDSGLWFKTEQDVCGHPVAVVAGSSQMAALERIKDQCPADKPMTMKVFSDQMQTLNDLAKRSVDAAYIDWPVVAYILQQQTSYFAEGSAVLSGKGPATQRNRNGIVIRKDEKEMQDDISGAFAAVLADGTYDSILKKWNLADGDIRKQND